MHLSQEMHTFEGDVGTGLLAVSGGVGGTLGRLNSPLSFVSSAGRFVVSGTSNPKRCKALAASGEFICGNCGTLINTVNESKRTDFRWLTS